MRNSHARDDITMFLPLSVLKVRAYGLLATGCIIALVMAGTAHPVDYQPGGTIRAGIYIDPPVTIRE
ncbi:MAG: hypothetical protein LIP23_04215, partial [Planctomycetes bacterium]|nr:hypothetical protein [Planctomycetota bacterium]